MTKDHLNGNDGCRRWINSNSERFGFSRASQPSTGISRGDGDDGLNRGIPGVYGFEGGYGVCPAGRKTNRSVIVGPGIGRT